MKFSHYSAAPIKRVRSYEQNKESVKPIGLWLSVDGPQDWPEWATRTQYDVIETQKLRYRVTLHMSRILVLSTPQELDDFTTGFVVVSASGLPTFINWAAVAELYAGIIIAPYQWTRRLTHVWYYPWDCASGCVWDAAAVLSVKRLKSVRPRRRKAT